MLSDLQSDTPPVQSRSAALIPWILAGAVLLIFGRTLTHDFVTWDDEQLIYRLNPDLNPPTLRGLENCWTAPRDLLNIPLVYSVWWGLANLGWLNVPDVETGSHLNALPFHCTNLLLHVLSTLAVYRILKMLFENPWAACCGALLFCVHPMQVEPVAWATGLKDVLGGALALWAIYFYVKHTSEPGRPRPDPPSRDFSYLIASTLFLLALLAKPSTVTAPLIAAVIVRLKTGKRWTAIATPLAPWFAAAIIFALIARRFQPATGIDPGPLWDRPLIATDALCFYLCKLVFPIQLTIDYCRRPVLTLATGWPYWTWIVPAGVFYGSYRSHNKILRTAVAVLVLALVPVLGLVRFQFQEISTVADRYLYLAMLGPAMAVCIVINRNRFWSNVLIATVLALLAGRAFLAAGVWRDSVTLYENAIAVHPESVLAHNNLGGVFERQGKSDLAIEQWKIAVALRPDSPEARDNLKDALAHRF